MERRFYKELWGLRFKKMLVLEEHGVKVYQRLLDESREKYSGHAIEPHLERLIADEKKHVTLVRELLEILAKQAD